MKLLLTGTAGPGGWPEPGCPCASCAGAAPARAPFGLVVDDVVAFPWTGVPRGYEVSADGLGLSGPSGHRILYAPADREPPPDPSSPYDVILIDLADRPERLGALRRSGAVASHTHVIAVGLDHRVRSLRELDRRLRFWQVLTVPDGTLLTLPPQGTSSTSDQTTNPHPGKPPPPDPTRHAALPPSVEPFADPIHPAPTPQNEPAADTPRPTTPQDEPAADTPHPTTPQSGPDPTHPATPQSGPGTDTTRRSPAPQDGPSLGADRSALSSRSGPARDAVRPALASRSEPVTDVGPVLPAPAGENATVPEGGGRQGAVFTLADGTVLDAAAVAGPGGDRRALILGGSRSGKSAEAELRLAAEPYVTYVATGPSGEGDAEWAARVGAHRARRPAHWDTEETTDLAGVIRAATAPLLIDGLGTWLAAVFDEHDAWEGDRGPVEARCDELVAAWRRARVRIVAVSDEVGMGVVPATASGRAFRDALGRLNERLAAESEDVTLVVAGRTVAL